MGISCMERRFSLRPTFFQVFACLGRQLVIFFPVNDPTRTTVIVCKGEEGKVRRDGWVTIAVGILVFLLFRSS